MPRAQARMTFGLMGGEASDDSPRGRRARPTPDAVASTKRTAGGGSRHWSRPRSPQRTSRRGEVIGPSLRPTVRPLHCAIIW